MGGIMPRIALSPALAFLCIALCLPISASASQQSEGEIKTFLDGIGEALYAFAWPTATYKGIQLQDIDSNPSGGLDVTLLVHGISAFSGDSLWTEVIITLQNWDITNLRWGRNNALLSPPGATVTALGEVLEELNRETNRPPSAESSAVVQSWTLTDGCADGTGVQFRIFELAGEEIRLTWPNQEQIYLINQGESLTVQVQTRRGAKLCYGGAPYIADSQLYWGIGIGATKRCEDCCRSADSSAVAFTLTCG